MKSLPQLFPQHQPSKLATADKTLALARSPWLARVDLGLLETLARFVDLYEFRKGEILFRQGDERAFMALLQTGRVEIRVEGFAGDSQTIALVGEGHPIGEMSLVDGGARSATAAVVEDAQVFILTDENFGAIRKRYPALWGALLIRFMRTITQRLRRQSGQFVALLAEHGSVQADAFAADAQPAQEQAPTFVDSDSQQLWKQLTMLNQQFAKVNHQVSRFMEQKKQTSLESGVRLPPALLEQLKQAAKSRGVPVAEYVVKLLDQQMNGLSQQSVDFLAAAVAGRERDA